MKMSEETQKARMAERVKRYDELRLLSKEQLLNRAWRLYRVSSISLKDSKRDLMYAVLDREIPIF